MSLIAKGKYEKWLTPEGLLKLEGWAREGLTDEQIAGKMGIHRDTLNEWKKKYSDISDTLKRGKEVVDLQVENALLKRAREASMRCDYLMATLNPDDPTLPVYKEWDEEKDIPEDRNDHTVNAGQYGWIPYRNMIGFEIKEEKKR